MNIGRAEPAQLCSRPLLLGRVLVVGDNLDARRALVDYLAGHQCLPVSTACADVGRHLAGNLISLVVADVREAPFDGFELLRQIRLRSDVPLILLTASRHGGLDRVVGLELGADELLCEPLNTRELLARARAILRRQEVGRRAAAPVVRGGYRFAGWELSSSSRTLTDPAGETVDLTKSEYALLVAFLEAPRRPLSRLQLVRATRQHEDISDRSIDVRVLRLRRKLEPNPGSTRLIRTHRGTGYVLDAAVETIF